jgi:AraC-like DNA-binding protein
MKEEKIFLTEDLTITALANELDISIHHLSQVINDKYKMNFSEYINRQRIEEAKRLIEKESLANIADIAFNVGFNSLSSFNNAFKKFTATTPSQFKDSL